MKDIDFDELDRAVNSLMSSVDEPKESTTAPQEPAQQPVAVAPAASVQNPVVQSHPGSPDRPRCFR